MYSLRTNKYTKILNVNTGLFNEHVYTSLSKKKRPNESELTPVPFCEVVNVDFNEQNTYNTINT